MSTLTDKSLSTDHNRATLDGAHSHGIAAPVVPEGSRADRTHSFDVAAFAMPNGREEVWRFSPLSDLAPLFDAAVAPDEAAYDVTAPEGVQVSSLAPGVAPRGSVLVPEDRIAAIASAATQEALYVRIPDGLAAGEPIHVTITGQGRSHAHLVVETGVHAHATIVLEHRGHGAHAGNVEAIVGAGSSLKIVSLQEWESDAVHGGAHHARVGRDATYSHVAVTLGGRAVRLGVTAEYDGPGGNAELLGLYYADAGQHLEHRTFIDHNAPQCTSNVAYKGALAGATARTVWIGDVLIRKAAEGTQTYELNRNLVLTAGARADSVPNLEIETGEIEGAGHASATGRFDDEHMFYLRSRGIPEDQARKLVVRGFFADLVRQIGVASVEDRLLNAIDAELDVALGSDGS